MKKLVYRELEDLKDVRRITVEVILEPIQLIQSSLGIKPIKQKDGKIDQVALDEYEEFVINALSVFDENDFHVIRERKTDRIDSNSWYFVLVKNDQFEAKNYEYILFIRLSDHKDNDDTAKARSNYHSEQAEELKMPKDKPKQKWRVKDVIVNKERYSSYDEALADIDRRLK